MKMAAAIAVVQAPPDRAWEPLEMKGVRVTSLDPLDPDQDEDPDRRLLVCEGRRGRRDVRHDLSHYQQAIGDRRRTEEDPGQTRQRERQPDLKQRLDRRDERNPARRLRGQPLRFRPRPRVGEIQNAVKQAPHDEGPVRAVPESAHEEDDERCSGATGDGRPGCRRGEDTGTRETTWTAKCASAPRTQECFSRSRGRQSFSSTRCREVSRIRSRCACNRRNRNKSGSRNTPSCTTAAIPTSTPHGRTTRTRTFARLSAITTLMKNPHSIWRSASRRRSGVEHATLVELIQEVPRPHDRAGDEVRKKENEARNSAQGRGRCRAHGDTRRWCSSAPEKCKS